MTGRAKCLRSKPVIREDRFKEFNSSNQISIFPEFQPSDHELNFHLFQVYSVYKHQSIFDSILKANLGLVRKCVYSFMGYKESPDDLYQAGCLGLIKAIERFDYLLEYAFSTFAMPYISGYINRHIQKNSNLIYLPANVFATQQKITKFSDRFSKTHNRKPTVDEIHKAIPDIEKDKIELTLKAYRQQPLSLDVKTTGGSSFFDVTPDPETTVVRYDHTSYLIDVIHSQLSQLEETTRQAIYLYYILSFTQKEVSTMLDLSIAEARSKINQGLRVLKRRCNSVITIDKFNDDMSGGVIPNRSRRKIATIPLN